MYKFVSFLKSLCKYEVLRFELQVLVFSDVWIVREA